MGDRARAAVAGTRGGWGTPSEVGGQRAPTADTRVALEEAWSRAALREHASIASFARFTLQLLQLGAPAQLVRDAGRAMQDEIAHAELCFALASRFAGRSIGPEELETEGSCTAMAPADIIEGAIVEGCIGETMAAFEASEALRNCEDDGAYRVLSAIERDEAKHAELAWRFVAWALETLPEAWVRPAAEKAFSRGARQLRASRAPLQSEGLQSELERFGVPPASLRPALVERVLTRVVEPCSRAVLSGSWPDTGQWSSP